MKIGVLIPHSKTYPSLGKDFLNGLKLTLSDYPNTSFLVEGIGIGSDKKIIIDKAQKLITQEDVQLITGLFGHLGIDELVDFMEGMETPLLYSDLGANLPKNLNDYDWSFSNSFELYKSASLFGQYAPKWGLKNIAVSTCYYDAGYGMTEALRHSLYESGGEFSGHFITPLHPRENEAELMESFITESKPDAVFSFHSGIFAREHAEFLSSNKIVETTPFYTTPFSIDDKMIKNNVDSLNGANSISSWFVDDDTPANENFISSYHAKHGKNPSPFALLGYENGLILVSALAQIGMDSVNPIQLKEAIKKTQAEGPRGPISFDENTKCTSYNQHLWNLEVEGGRMIHRKKERLEEDKSLTNSLRYNNDQQKISGWHNAYLCD